MAKVIELAGMPRSGKTQLAHDLKDYLYYERGLSVRLCAEAAHSSPLPKKDKCSYHIWNINRTVNDTLEAKNTQDYDFVIIDRGVFDGLVLTTAFERTGQLPVKLAEQARAYLQQFLHLDDLVAILLMKPEESYSRAGAKLALSSTRNMQFLSVWYGCYGELLKGLHANNHVVFYGLYDAKELESMAQNIVLLTQPQPSAPTPARASLSLQR